MNLIQFRTFARFATTLQIMVGLGISTTLHASENAIDQVPDNFGQEKIRARQIDFLQSYVKRYPENIQAWEALARTQENAQQIPQAIATWQYIGKHFNRMTEAVGNQALILRKNGQPEKALSILQSHQGNATAKDQSFWEIFGDLAWELEQTEHSLTAYRILWKSDSTNALVPERLIHLTRNMAGKAEEAIAVGEEAYQRLGDARWLLLAMDVANQTGRIPDLKRLMNKAAINEQQFQNVEMYWLMRAQLEIHKKNPRVATSHYQKALSINPQSAIAKEGILWNLIGQNDKPALESYLKMWHQEALQNTSLWAVYAIALTQIGQNKEALVWFERKLRNKPDDYLWLLTYADVLNRAGYVDKALQQRKYALFQLRSRFNQLESKSDRGVKDLLRPEYLSLIRELEGSKHEISTLKNFLAKGYEDPAVQELLIAAYLSQKNISSARYWLLENHLERQNTPTWQRLSLALAENDLATADHILSNESDKLTDLNKMEILKRLNRNDEALALTYKLLDLHREPSALQAYLFQSRDDLVVKTSKQASAGFDYRSLGDVTFAESRARISSPYLGGTLAAEFKDTVLGSTRSDLILPVQNEVDIMAEYRHPLREGTFQANMGGNLRQDESLPYGTFRINQDVTKRIKANFRFGMNEMSHETGAFRALGAKDTILLGLSTQLTQQMTFTVEADGHRYSTREGSNLGKGYKLQSILGASLLNTGTLNWQVRLQGAWESNDLASSLPSELRGRLGASREEVLTLVPKNFGTMGAGMVFRYGPSEQGILKRPFFLVDAWSGWVWPADALGYNGRVSIGIPILGPDMLSVGGFYSNIQGGRTNQPFTGIGIQYSLRF
ncbi:hypothetical protein ABF87_10145 [Nitrosomonas sp. JL21]|nr:tetratricopeptide repeat protein [Nitrosomonas sp.]MXS78312.1 hypothetical protein [Nitrosomonas sp. JL21]